MRLGKALATGIAEERPHHDEQAQEYGASVPEPDPRTRESAEEPRPAEAAAAR
ncbi:MULTISPECIES: hypothetical protein [Streptomyces]|uniref:hypothetical protein n=1 Tax=Streptomyces TaxID=1883 RepID=UPI000B0BE438|nr:MULTISPECIES: hypothetical protein [Streptomyces]MCF3124762.1 hypothetical protein [Streptomyces arenae]